MKKSLIILFLINSFTLGYSQNYFSNSISSNDFVNSGGIVQFNNKTLIIASEFCNDFMGNNCGYILEIENDGTISYLHDLGEIFLYDKVSTSNENRLTIVGRNDNNSITIFQFDTDMAEVQQQTYDVSVPLWIFDVIEYAGYYVVAAYNYGSTDTNFPRLYWFDATDLSLDYVYIDQIHESSFRELSIDSDNNLRVFNTRNDENYILSFNTDKELMDEWETEESGTISYLNFEMIQNDQFLFGLVDNKYLKCYNSEGQLNWERDIASAFGISEILFIRQLKEVSNGDILLCGSLQLNNNFSYGFIYLLSSDGIEKWKRIYSINGSFANRFKDFSELSNNDYLFYGTSRLEDIPTTNFHDSHWVVKTNADGCIDSYCGDEITTVNSSDLRRFDVEIYPNPITSHIVLGGIEYNQPVKYRLTDLSGKTILQGTVSNQIIDVGSLNPGIYFLHLNLEDIGTLTKKIVKGNQ